MYQIVKVQKQGKMRIINTENIVLFFFFITVVVIKIFVFLKFYFVQFVNFFRPSQIVLCSLNFHFFSLYKTFVLICELFQLYQQLTSFNFAMVRNATQNFRRKTFKLYDFIKVFWV